MTFYEISVASDWPHNIYNVHIYFDLISLRLSYLNFSHLSFVMQAWVSTHQLHHMRAAGYSKFSNSGYCKLAISTILLVDLEAHFFRHMFSCFWSSEQHLALCLQCVSLLYCSKIPLFQEHDQTGVLLSMLSLTADHKTY